MKPQNQPQAERLAELELLANETGLLDELKTRQRAEIDKRRMELAAKLDTLPNPERELAILAKAAAHAHAAFEKAATEYHEAECRDKEATGRLVIATMSKEGERQHIVSELERAAPPELEDALDDLNLADNLLRSAFRVDEVADRNWLGQRVKRVISNLDGISSARKQIAAAQQSIRELAHDGRMPSDVMVSRCAEIVEAALQPVLQFVPAKLWDLRRSKPLSDIVAEVTGYLH
ncbi:hypothetical protein [Paraburkholderia sediminicola]|uniref:hypothetical protein n=1 Tax=Paraburkholderia sediminicola TaxID=458836 RepID=UPI0038B6F7E9